MTVTYGIDLHQRFSTLFNGMEPLGAFRLLAQPHTVTYGLIYSEWTETLFSYMHEKHRMTQL